MLTKSDLQKIKQVTKEVVAEVGVTKEEAKKFATKDELKNLSENIVQFKDEILSEIKDLREEVLVVTGYKEAIENHEERITTLEEKTGIAS